MIALLLNHLWQSSLCVAVAGLLALSLRRNGANVRFWLWFAASVKFLVPFAVLTAMSTYVLMPFLAPIVPPQPVVALIEPLVKPLAGPFAGPLMAAPITEKVAALPTPMALTIAGAKPSAAPAVVLTTAKPAALNLESVLLAVWLAGFLIITLRWLARWSRLRALLRQALEVKTDAPIAVKFSASLLEPGLAGIIRPVILLPQGIEQQLSGVELKAVLAHELCHWRRRDNLLASIHMLVEALFWFFPLVWWLGTRLNAERERACDESVLAEGNDPQEYAEGILKVCRAYLQSPLACVAGVSGGGLKRRIDAIMENRLIPQLNAARKLVLSASAVLVLVPPLLLGLSAVPVAQIQAKAAQVLTPIAQKTALAPAPATTSAAEPAPNQRTASALPSPIGTAQPESLAPPAPPALPNETPPTPIEVAQNATQTLPDLGATTGLLPYIIPSDGVTALVARRDLSTEHVCFNASVTGRVLSRRAIQIGSFTCQVQRVQHSVIGEPSNSGFIMNVELARSSDAERMARGTIVTLGADFKVLVKDEVRYLVADNARILSLTPAASPAQTPSTETDQAAATPSTAVASNAQPVTPLQPTTPTANAPLPKTEAGLRCLLGMGAWRCERALFENGRSGYPQPLGCASEDWLRSAGACRNLERIEYLGTNAAGDDVYSVKFMDRNQTYILPPPGPDGKIATRCRFNGSLAGVLVGGCLDGRLVRPSAAQVTSPAPRILYSRTDKRSDAGGLTQVAAASTEVDASSGKTLDSTRTIKPHAETARAMLCLLGADPKATCRDDFYGPARFGAIRFMQWTIGQRNFNLGALVSAEYVWTQTQNAYTTAALHGRTADVYRVKFERQETTYYIARPDPDGKIHSWFGRNGGPEDEKTEPVGMSRVR